MPWIFSCCCSIFPACKQQSFIFSTFLRYTSKKDTHFIALFNSWCVSYKTNTRKSIDKSTSKAYRKKMKEKLSISTKNLIPFEPFKSIFAFKLSFNCLKQTKVSYFKLASILYRQRIFIRQRNVNKLLKIYKYT